MKRFPKRVKIARFGVRGNLPTLHLELGHPQIISPLSDNVHSCEKLQHRQSQDASTETQCPRHYRRYSHSA
jgi:hypothetical protein